ncbi:hypothetical protein ACH5RR_014495 [Cinchona calisaya]|uniref:Uncharacterized protein n=1 Tax=Cinchona calisaya TaxID=153742 RepID=A0ABD3A3L4_9GENT
MHPRFWIYRLLCELMIQAAAVDVHILPYIYQKVMEKLSEESLWRPEVRSIVVVSVPLAMNRPDWPPIQLQVFFWPWVAISNSFTLGVKDSSAFRGLRVTLGPVA